MNALGIKLGLVTRSLAACIVLLALVGCHRRGPTPAYPAPRDPPLEESDLAQYLESPDGGADAEAPSDVPDESSEDVTPPR